MGWRVTNKYPLAAVSSDGMGLPQTERWDRMILSLDGTGDIPPGGGVGGGPGGGAPGGLHPNKPPVNPVYPSGWPRSWGLWGLRGVCWPGPLAMRDAAQHVGRAACRGCCSFNSPPNGTDITDKRASVSFVSDSAAGFSTVSGLLSVLSVLIQPPQKPQNPRNRAFRSYCASCAGVFSGPSISRNPAGPPGRSGAW